MISFTSEMQWPLYCTSATLCFVILAVLYCWNGVLHRRPVRMVDPLRIASESNSVAAPTEYQQTMAMDLGTMLDAGDGAVVTLVAGDTQLAAHSAVLAAGSPVFSAMFSHDTLEASTGEVTIPDLEGPVLRQLLAYLYSHRAPQLPGMAHQLLAAADKYGVSALKDSCEQQVAEQLDVENAATTAVLAVKHCCFSLRQAAVAFLRVYTHEVMATQGWAEAVVNHPKDVVEFTRLLAGTSTAATSDSKAKPTIRPHGFTPAAAAPPTAHHQTHPPDAAAISCLRRLSDNEKCRRLIQAAKDGAAQEVRVLLAAGADVGVREEGWRQWTALHHAAREGHMDVVWCLLQARAEVDTRDRRQSTPLHTAAVNGHTSVVQQLLAAFADPNARDVDGRTSLHWAAYCGHAEAVTALLEAGANRGAMDNSGRTPQDIARDYYHQDLIYMLQ